MQELKPPRGALRGGGTHRNAGMGVPTPIIGLSMQNAEKIALLISFKKE